MTIIAERVFVVRVKLEAPNLSALDEASALLESKFQWWPVRFGRTPNVRVVAASVHRGA